MAYDPQAGDVIRYDYLWKEEQKRGRDEGSKDRPCAIVLAAKPNEDGTKQVLIAPITHSPPSWHEGSVEIPAAVSRHLGLDDGQSWIKTHEVNVVTWPAGKQMPYGVTPAKQGEWTYGKLPQGLSKQVFESIRERSQARTLKRVDRTENRGRGR